MTHLCRALPCKPLIDANHMITGKGCWLLAGLPPRLRHRNRLGCCLQHRQGARRRYSGCLWPWRRWPCCHRGPQGIESVSNHRCRHQSCEGAVCTRLGRDGLCQPEGMPCPGWWKPAVLLLKCTPAASAGGCGTLTQASAGVVLACMDSRGPHGVRPSACPLDIRHLGNVLSTSGE